jgi:outer membrane protein OmpA-like peptidoglycan-associated protein
MKNFLIVFMMAMMVTACASSNNGFFNGIDISDRSMVVEAKGVPAPVVEVAEVPEPPVVEIVKVADIHEAILFPFDSTEITMDEQAKLVKIADMMNEYPETIVVIEGFASKEGTDEYNLALSQARADVVKDELNKMGIASDRIMSVDGKGETEEFDFTSLSPNRRVLVITVN